jgi:hypothetical protein
VEGRVRADSLLVGDVVVLPTEEGSRTLRIEKIAQRSATIKFIGHRVDVDVSSDVEHHWGWASDRIVELVGRERSAKG